jgi:HAMP domain-containing protein
VNVNQPLASTPIGWVEVDGKRFPVATHPEFVRFFDSMLVRVGGTSGPSTPDLVLAQFEDAGIEETKALLSTGLDELRQSADNAALREAIAAPPDQILVSELREELQALAARIEALERGVSL